MKITSKILFASGLMLSIVAPTLSQAAYFVDQSKDWAVNTPAQNPMGTKVGVHRANRGLDSMAHAPLELGTNFGERYFHDRGIGNQS